MDHMYWIVRVLQTGYTDETYQCLHNHIYWIVTQLKCKLGTLVSHISVFTDRIYLAVTVAVIIVIVTQFLHRWIPHVSNFSVTVTVSVLHSFFHRD